RIAANVFYETQEGPGTEARIEHGNVGGRFHEISLGNTIARRKQRLDIGYNTPLLMGLLLRFENELAIAWYQLGGLHDSLATPVFGGDLEISIGSRFSRDLTRWLSVSLGGELVHTEQQSAPELPTISTNLNIISSASFHFIDAPFNPARGMTFKLNLGNGGRLQLDNFSKLIGARHNWIELQTSWYYPLPGPLIAAMRGDGGRFFGDGGINAREFYLGGPRSIRAFMFRDIRPGDPGNAGMEPAYYLFSGELRAGLFDFGWFRENVPLGKSIASLRFVPFVDYGKVWNLRYAFELHGTGEALAGGIGLRYPLLGVFNIRVDFAWGTVPAGDETFRVVMDLANAF
ncbi:MAG: BamA/TamA family outer membrane protein, partial [Chitinivibrionales bacterium]|nr:BamA/TamA family outer membrane protein [Chitinivibrionales bacterium]